MHIPKSGGTSLADALVWPYPLSKIFNNNGFISIEYLKSIINVADSDSIILGHPERGAARFLADKADIITLLRAPDQHAVSNFLQIRRHPDDPRHQWAASLSFTDYIRKFPDHIVNQALVLDQAIMASPATGLTDLSDNILLVKEFIKSIRFSGVLERAAESCEILSDILGTERVISMMELNSARSHGETYDEVFSLRCEYDDLRRGGEFETLFELEHSVYAVALENVHEIRKKIPPKERSEIKPALELRAHLFSSHHGVMKHARVVTPVNVGYGHLIFGPYISISKGLYGAKCHINKIDFDLRGEGVFFIEAVSNRDIILGRYREDLLILKNSPGLIKFTFFSIDDIENLEFRISVSSQVSGFMTFSGIDIYKAIQIKSYVAIALLCCVQLYKRANYVIRSKFRNFQKYFYKDN